MFVALDSAKTGVDFANTLKSSPELNILNYLYYYNGGGVAAGDFNNDGLIDLFFTGNQTQDALYINTGNLTFENVTKHSGILNEDSWSTGVSHVDINNDGLLDIYICKASGYRNLTGRNLLYVNLGIDSNGIPTFREEASKYGLDFSGLSTHSSFFDYDLDGDLDLYLLNHSVHPNRNYGHGNLRKGYDSLAGDVLFQNNNGIYEDVSESAGIFRGRLGYGLGVSIGDLNNDGYPDIYVGNDFFENDYLYINQGDGTFNDVISEDAGKLGHTTHFSMGNTTADLNNDGMIDIISLDMLPEDLQTYKSSGLEYAYPIYRQYLKKGYSPQYMQNTLHFNLDGRRFAEIGHLSGISATEWSWGILAADFDNDTYKDLFISNGILGATNDMDYMNFIANEDIQRRIDAGLVKSDLPMIEEIPQKKVPNYLFKNNGDLTFKNVSTAWAEDNESFSNGCVYADLDNDGDLDIVVNNINAPVTILENKSEKANYLRVKFTGAEKNPYGIGAKVILYSNTKQVLENFPSKGYLSTVTPELHFGLGKVSLIDSLQIIWPGGSAQTMTDISINQNITLKYKDSKAASAPNSESKFRYLAIDSILDFVHKENVSLDFDREPLLPFANSNQGPCISISDVNNDGLQDVFIGGAKKQRSRFYIQTPTGGFEEVQSELFEENAIGEVTASLFFDANGDGQQDLLVGYGGNEFASGGAIRLRMFLNQNGNLTPHDGFSKPIESNISALKSIDFDNDGDLDLVVASDQIPGQFGKTSKSYLLSNDGAGNFNDITQEFAPTLATVGNIKDVCIADLNSDGKKDLIAVGHWMDVSLFINEGRQLTLQTNNGLGNTSGWWNTVEVADFDQDGDLDLICGNWGMNSKFKASKEKPVTLYRNDFDGNGTVEALVTYYHKNVETPFASKDELVKQMPFLNKEFLSYSKFAAASLKQLFGEDKLDASEQKRVVELKSCYFENLGDGTFEKKALPLMAQVSQVNEIVVEDTNGDSSPDVILMGNNHHISTQLGRLDALHGLILTNNEKGEFNESIEHLGVDGQVNAIEKLIVNGKSGFIIGRNDETPVFLTEKK